jgi:hypothetical protein
MPMQAIYLQPPQPGRMPLQTNKPLPDADPSSLPAPAARLAPALLAPARLPRSQSLLTRPDNPWLYLPKRAICTYADQPARETSAEAWQG